jgi:hypothetical protein
MARRPTDRDDPPGPAASPEPPARATRRTSADFRADLTSPSASPLDFVNRRMAELSAKRRGRKDEPDE